MLLPFIFLSCCLSGQQLSDQSGSIKRQDFSLQAEVLEALEGGPLVVRATLIYRGTSPVKVYRNPDFPDAYLESPQGWTRRAFIVMCLGPSVGEFDFAPGGKKTETLLVHHDYTNLTAGKTTVQVVWPIHAPSTDGLNPGPLVAKLSTALEIDIPPATSERLAALRKRMEEQLRQPDLSDWDQRRLGEDIIDTRHCALAPVAWRLIESPRRFDLTRELIEFVSECPDDAQDLDVRVAKLAADPTWPGASDAFDFWRKRKTDLSPAAWKTLTESESVWTRALTFVVFPQRCGKEWKESLLQDLRTQTQPLPPSQFDHLLADLDSDDFDVREKASARLMRLGERVEAQLRHAQDGPLSPEAARRVRDLLDKLRSVKQPPDCLRTLEWLGSSDRPEADEILEVLAQGAPDAWLTQQAKAKLAQWRKDQERPDK